MNINIYGIEQQIIVGCYPCEKQAQQAIIMDITAELYSHNWSEDDILTSTVDYDKLLISAKQLLATKPYNLLEGLSQFVADGLLAEFPQLATIRVDLVKPALSGKNAREIKVSYTTKRKHKVALALGSNHDYLPQQQLITAGELLAKDISDIQFAEFYQTKPFGVTKQNDFINTAIIGITTLQPQELLAQIKFIEKLMGKHELIANGPRIIDIDIIFFADLIYRHNFLIIPHKDMHVRDFVLKPLSDIAGNWCHPQLQLTVNEIYAQLDANLKTNIIQKVPYYKDAV